MDIDASNSRHAFWKRFYTLPMRISFDLDDTLICHRRATPTEPRLPWFGRLFGRKEPLRRGTVALMHRLQREGWEIWIYTTSLRAPAVVRRWFRFYGVDIVRVINQDTHLAAARQASAASWPSKNPAAFGIDLHVDDSPGVHLEGQRHGFQVVVVDVDDDGWAARVSDAADRIRAGAVP